MDIMKILATAGIVAIIGGGGVFLLVSIAQRISDIIEDAKKMREQRREEAEFYGGGEW